jgi:hypothetical protein
MMTDFQALMGYFQQTDYTILQSWSMMLEDEGKYGRHGPENGHDALLSWICIGQSSFSFD